MLSNCYFYFLIFFSAIVYHLKRIMNTGMITGAERQSLAKCTVYL